MCDEPNAAGSRFTGVVTRAGRFRILGAAMAATAAVVFIAACGSSSGSGGTGEAPDYSKSLAGAPRPLAALYAQADQLLPGGTEAFQRRLAQLRGHPVVVNQWASWCGPCREEMPWYQRLSAKLGKRIAFLGVDSQDSDAAAKDFLKEFPLPYPSYTDPGKDIAKAMNATIGLPDTAIYDSSGKQVHVQQGQYSSEAALEADIKRYAQ
jgi:cytochrome c biogenesis protein CcmG, thiol:disulfide interchange protein DsbE